MTDKLDQGPDTNRPATSGFAAAVHTVVARIPYGTVTTYGTIARALGFPRHARMVGWAVHDPPAELDLPCHRVVNRNGYLSGGIHFGHPEVMQGLLLAEGITFVEEYRVDLSRHLWDPSSAADEMGDFDDIAVR
jgi:methylated-DNA-protein-cysteine methyltransferase related protein